RVGAGAGVGEYARRWMRMGGAHVQCKVRGGGMHGCKVVDEAMTSCRNKLVALPSFEAKHPNPPCRIPSHSHRFPPRRCAQGVGLAWKRPTVCAAAPLRDMEPEPCGRLELCHCACISVSPCKVKIG